MPLAILAFGGLASLLRAEPSRVGSGPAGRRETPVCRRVLFIQLLAKLESWDSSLTRGACASPAP